jgi:hypothetical protein
LDGESTVVNHHGVESGNRIAESPCVGGKRVAHAQHHLSTTKTPETEIPIAVIETDPSLIHCNLRSRLHIQTCPI